MIRANLDGLADLPPNPTERLPAPLGEARESEAEHGESPGMAGLSGAAAGPVLGAAQRKGRGGRTPVRRRGRARSHRRASAPRSARAGALRSRLALQSAAASAKILRLNADAAALRDLRFALGDELSPAAKLLSLWRDLGVRPPSLDPGRILTATAALDLALPDPNGLASSLKDCAGEGDPVSAAAKAAVSAFSIFPDAPAAEAEILALWLFDLTIAIRLRWPRPLPLIATKVLDPALRSDGGGRLRPGDPAWPKTAAGAIALAAASALDLAADLSRRSDTLLAVAPKLRAKPALKIAELLLAEDCVSPAEAARQAPMTDRAARRLFDRLVTLGAVRELTGRPTFRLYGL